MPTTAARPLPNISIPEKLIKTNPFVNDKKAVEPELLAFVSEGLEFHDDVVQQLCPAAVSFADYNAHALYAAKREVTRSRRTPRRLRPIDSVSVPHARRVHAQKPIAIEPAKFVPTPSLFYMTEVDDAALKPMDERPVKALATATHRSESLEVTKGNVNGLRRSYDSIERQARLIAEKESAQMERNWDRYMFEHMDEHTATYIILKHVHDDERRARLIKYLKRTYHITKLPNPDEMELIPMVDDRDETDIRYRFHRPALGKDGVVARLPTDSHQAPGNEEQMEEFVEPVDTSQQMTTSSSHILDEPSFYDVMSNKISTTVYRTEHPYEQAMLLGNNVHRPTDQPGVILLSNSMQFDKVLQTNLPPDPDSIASTLHIDPSATFDRAKPAHGFRRWKTLPKIKDTNSHLQSSLSDRSINRAAAARAFFAQHSLRPPDINDLSLMWLMPETSGSRSNRVLKSNTTVSRMVEEWRRKWAVDGQWTDADVDDLHRDLGDTHPHVRFAAIVICSRAGQYLSKEELDRGLKIRPIPEPLLLSMESLLNDPQERIRTAAAIAMTTLHQYSPQVEDILRSCVANGHSDDRLIAAQCLASLNLCTSDIIQEILTNYFDTADEWTREQLILSLAKLSQRTTLVHSLIGEYLNSADPGDRIVACKLYPLLKSQPNKDITQKLVHLMWQDMNSHVRRIAGQTLGKCGCGQAVHEEMVSRLQSQHWQDRVEALRLLGYLGVLTAKFMQPYFKCFKDDHVSVRDHACRVSYKLQLRDECVRDLLLERIEFDPVAKVRYSAVEALGLYAMTDDKCRSALLWSIRYDQSVLVRAAAPNALVLLERANEEILDTLQSRFLVEKEPVVVQSLKEALEAYHCNLTQDVPIVQEIRNEVRKLNSKDVIWQKITKLERDLRFTADMERLIAPSTDQPLTPPPPPDETDNQSATTYSNVIQNVADSNLADGHLPQRWSPELWRVDAKSGQLTRQPIVDGRAT